MPSVLTQGALTLHDHSVVFMDIVFLVYTFPLFAMVQKITLSLTEVILLQCNLMVTQ